MYHHIVVTTKMSHKCLDKYQMLIQSVKLINQHTQCGWFYTPLVWFFFWLQPLNVQNTLTMSYVPRHVPPHVQIRMLNLQLVINSVKKGVSVTRVLWRKVTSVLLRKRVVSLSTILDTNGWSCQDMSCGNHEVCDVRDNEWGCHCQNGYYVLQDNQMCFRPRYRIRWFPEPCPLDHRRRWRLTSHHHFRLWYKHYLHRFNYIVQYCSIVPFTAMRLTTQ